MCNLVLGPGLGHPPCRPSPKPPLLPSEEVRELFGWGSKRAGTAAGPPDPSPGTPSCSPGWPHPSGPVPGPWLKASPMPPHNTQSELPVPEAAASGIQQEGCGLPSRAQGGFTDIHKPNSLSTLYIYTYKQAPPTLMGPGEGSSVLHLWHQSVKISFSVQHELNILSVFVLSHGTFTVQWGEEGKDSCGGQDPPGLLLRLRGWAGQGACGEQPRPACPWPCH